ncbi:transposase [Streptomyces sp. enrichment culture]|uniref:transposase n=1 Tax=Streptomyces sp. enrichment culture TaxID=1795815 RepID=UPI003F568E48
MLDNHATHRAPAIKTRLSAHPRLHLHFTPTGSTWLNQVEPVARRADRQADTAGRPQERPGTGEGHPHLDRRGEHRSQALRPDEDRRRDPRMPRQSSEQNS